MASRLLGVAFEATEFFSPLLQKIGISKWFKYLDLTSIIRGVLINPRQMAAWIKDLAVSSTVIKTVIATTITNFIYDNVEVIDDLYDKYNGDVKAYVFGLANEGICAAMNEAILQKFGVVTNITKVYPLDDKQVLEDLLFELGKIVAKLLNERYGTNFVSVLPAEQFAQVVKTQLISELTSSSRRLLSNADVASFLDGLNKLREGEYIGQIANGGLVINHPTGSVADLVAERRYYNRERQRKYRLTHERVSHAWKLKGT